MLDGRALWYVGLISPARVPAPAVRTPRPNRWRWLPPEATPDAAVLLTARGVRAFADGFVSVLLPAYLLGLGFDGFQIGAVATATLIGSAALTLLVGLVAHRFRARPLLASAAVLMAATGAGFVLVHEFWPLLLVAFVGTLNPSSGDVSVFLPLEQSALPRTVSASQRTALFARYSLVGSLVGAVGALCAGLPQVVATRAGLPLNDALHSMFVLYAALGLVALALYRRLSASLEEAHEGRAPLRESQRIVYTLAALFSLDALGGGFIVQSLLALWLFERFDLSIATAGTIFFWTGVLSAGSYLVAAARSAGGTTATTYEPRVGTSICDSALRASSNTNASGRLGMNGTSNNRTLEGRWVNTIVFTRPMRCASRAATRYEPAESSPVQKKMVPAVAIDRSNRSNSQSASRDWTMKPPPSASRLNNAASV